MEHMVDILLPTYNGENWILELLDSIVAQSYRDWRIIIRDDGSNDRTVETLNRFHAYLGTKIIFEKGESNLGVIQSFEYLLRKSTADYIMFCDQDDVWLPDKIEKTLDKMKLVEMKNPNLPVLIHTDLSIVDESLNEIHPSLWDYAKLDPKLLKNFKYLGVCNGITGCTTMINRSAKEISLPFSSNARMHDSWIALKVSQYGVIDYVRESTILYRQHGSNTLGADKVPASLEYVNNKIQNLSKVIADNKKQWALLKELSYGNKIQYMSYKIKYFIKARL